MAAASVAAFVAAARGASALEGLGGRSFLAIFVTGLAVLLALTAASSWRRARLRAPPHAVEELLRGTAGLLGDAALVFDVRGRLVWANEAALALSPEVATALLRRAPRVLGDDVVTLRRGLHRGPAAGRVTIPSRGGPVAAQAAATRVPGEVPVDVVLLRLAVRPPDLAAAYEVRDADILPEPPALPPRKRGRVSGSGVPDGDACGAALRAELGSSLGRSSSAAALLRMVLPPGHLDAAQYLATIEEELRHAEAVLSALTAPLAAPVRRSVDVDSLLSEALATLSGVEAIEIARDHGRARAVADPAQLRQALRHVLQVAVARMPCGGTLSLRTRAAGGEVIIEVTDTGAALEREAGVGLPLAQRLVAAQGGTLQLARTPGRGSLTRLSLPAAAAVRVAGA